MNGFPTTNGLRVYNRVPDGGVGLPPNPHFKDTRWIHLTQRTLPSTKSFPAMSVFRAMFAADF